MSFKELFFLPLLSLIAAKSQKRQRHSAGKAGEPPPPRKCEELQATLTRKEEIIISNINNRLQDLEGMSNGQKQKILELQDLASVQKEHLSSVECGAKEEVEKLKLQIQQLQGSCVFYYIFIK